MTVRHGQASVGIMNLAAWAEQTARTVLQDSLPRRWAHSQGVAARARALSQAVGPDAELLEAAAWVHDIGYAPGLDATGFHPLDGARYLRDVQHAGPVLCALVAHHSYALVAAGDSDLARELAVEFPDVPGPLLAALSYCDMTTSPDGAPVSFAWRLADIHARYGDGHTVTEGINRSLPQLSAAIETVQLRQVRVPAAV